MSVAKAMDYLMTAMRDDPEYAWSWHCNLAMPIMDSVGCSHKQANIAAAHLMSFLFDRDVTKDPRFEYEKGDAQKYHETRLDLDQQEDADRLARIENL